MILLDRLVITLWMSRFDELSFASSLTLSVLAWADPQSDPTKSTRSTTASHRRIAFPLPRLARNYDPYRRTLLSIPSMPLL